MPVLKFGGVERVTCEVAKALQAGGFSTSLLLLGEGEQNVPDFARPAFDDLFFARVASHEIVQEYHDTPIFSYSFDVDVGDILNLLSVFDCVVSCHSAATMSLMGPLRSRGVVTVSHIHVYDLNDAGVSVGHPSLALGFDHALDVVATCSAMLASTMFGLGLPADKVISVPNCATIVPMQERIEGILRNRAQRDFDKSSLRVGFIGRLDWQKGIDRLGKLIASMRKAIPIEFRIVGGHVVGDSNRFAEADIHIEDAIYDSESISEFYLWCDVIVVPSRFEGLPLVILEAMAHGVVPICTDVGACSEVLIDGVNGFLVRGGDDKILSEFRRRIIALDRDRVQLRQVAHTAREFAMARDWSTSCSSLVERIKSLVAERRNSYGIPPALLSILGDI